MSPEHARMRLAGLVLLLLLPARAVKGQMTVDPPDSAAAVLAHADSLHAAGDAAAALGLVREALRNGEDLELLWRAARETVHLGILDEDAGLDEAATRWFATAEAWSDRAIELDSADARGWTWKAISLGRRSETVGSMDRVEMANRIKETAEAALARDPDQSGALHVLGAWHAEILRLNAVERFTARRLLGGHTFDAANWEDAEALLRRATERSPEEIVHRLEYARVLDDLDRRAEALEQLRIGVALPLRHPADAIYHRQVSELLAEWGG